MAADDRMTDTVAQAFVLQDYSMSTLTIGTYNGPVLILKPDGTIERGSAFASDDEATVQVFDALSCGLSSWMSALRERAEKAEADLSRMQDRAEAAEERVEGLQEGIGQ